MAKDERVERLRSVPLFAGCNDKQLEFIATRVEDLDFPSGRTLCEQGQSGADFFVILSGQAEVRRNGTVLRTLGPGEFFGEISLVDNTPRSATVVSVTPMRCLVLGPNQFQDVLFQSADIAVQVLHAVATRLRATGTVHAD